MANNSKLVLVIPKTKDGILQAAILKTLARLGLAIPKAAPEESPRIVLEAPAREALQKSGFSNIAIENRDERYYFSNLSEFKQWVRGTAIANRGIPEEREQEFLDILLEEYLALDPQPTDRGIAVKFSHLIVYADANGN